MSGRMYMEDRAKFQEDNFKFLNNPSFAPKFETSEEQRRKLEAFLKARETERAGQIAENAVHETRKRAKKKAEERLKAEQIEAERQKKARAVAQRPTAKTPVEDAGFAESMQTFFLVQEDWISYEMDILKVVDNPFLFDMREDEVRNFNNSMQKLAILFRKGKTDILQLMSLPELTQQVRTLAFTWETLKVNSAKMKDSSFKEGERNRIKQARRLLSIAMNSGSSVSERQIAYRRALKELDHVLIVPKRALEEIESRMPLLAIEP